jgi:hypothetical protein
VRFALCSLAAFAVVASTSCGGATKPCIEHGVACERLPRAKTYSLNWVERAPHKAATFRVHRIHVDSNGWNVRLSITNGAPRAFTFPRGGARSPISFGLGVFDSPLPRRVEDPGNYLLRPTKIAPAFPGELAPGETWTGTLAGDAPPRTNRWLRVLFGVFFWKGEPPYDFGPFFAWQTNHVVKTPPPVGAAAR